MIVALWATLALADPGSDLALGDCASVLSLVRQDGDDAARAMRGRCLVDTDPAAAEATLAPIQGGVWADYAAPLRARAALASQRPADALNHLSGRALPGRAGLELRLLRARALLALGRSLEARDDLRLLTETEVADEARWLLGRGALDRGERDAAIALLRRLWALSVVGPWRDAAADLLSEAGAPLPDAARAADHPLLRERVAALRAAQQHAEATTLLLTVDAADPATASDGAMARALFEARRYAEAAAAWEGVHGAPPVGPPGDLYDHGLAFVRSGQPERGQAVWARLQDLHPGSTEADEAAYKTAWLLVDAGQCAEAIPALDAHLRTRPATAWSESARWFKGRCQWRLGLRAEALATWDALLARHPDSSLAPAAAYWRAVAADDRAALSALVSRWPLTGHAWLAAARLGLSFPGPTQAASPPPWPSDLAAHPAVSRALALAQAGFLREARDEAAPLVSHATDLAHALPVAALLVYAGDAATARKVVGRWCPSSSLPADRALREACWPRPLESLVGPTAARWGLPPGLPWAIALAESRLDPSVTSAAGARGLMQVMPAEGERLHAAAGLPGEFDADRLYVASYNAALGTTELGLKRRSLDGALTPDALPAVIASYNAGEDAVRRWLVPGGAADDFAEDIPYTETRRYVRTVLGYLMAWRQVYGDGP